MSMVPDDFPRFGMTEFGRRWMEALSPLQLYAVTVSATLAIIGGFTVFSVL